MDWILLRRLVLLEHLTVLKTMRPKALLSEKLGNYDDAMPCPDTKLMPQNAGNSCSCLRGQAGRLTLCLSPSFHLLCRQLDVIMEAPDITELPQYGDSMAYPAVKLFHPLLRQPNPFFASNADYCTTKHVLATQVAQNCSNGSSFTTRGASPWLTEIS